MRKSHSRWLYALLTVATIVVAIVVTLGCSPEETAPRDKSPVILRLPAVAPKNDIKSMAITSADRPLVAGERVRIEGEYDAKAMSDPPDIIYLEIRLEARGKSIIMDIHRVRGEGNGKYGYSIDVPNRAGEYELLVRISDNYIGRSRITIVEPSAAEGARR